MANIDHGSLTLSLGMVPLLLDDNASAHKSHVGLAAVREREFEEKCAIHRILLTRHHLITV